MARLHMNWDWVRGHKIMVFSEWLKPGAYNVKIMVGENPAGPRGVPKWTGTVTSSNASLSHAEVFAAAARYADKKMAEAGVPLHEYDLVLGGYQKCIVNG